MRYNQGESGRYDMPYSIQGCINGGKADRGGREYKLA